MACDVRYVGAADRLLDVVGVGAGSGQHITSPVGGDDLTRLLLGEVQARSGYGDHAALLERLHSLATQVSSDRWGQYELRLSKCRKQAPRKVVRSPHGADDDAIPGSVEPREQQ